MKKRIEENPEVSKYLPNKRVILMPTPRKGGLVNDPNHMMYFMADNARQRFSLPRLETPPGPFVNPFSSDEEMKFFEKLVGEDLNPSNKNNTFWKKFKVEVVKLPGLLTEGITYDLSDPWDNLRVKVLKFQPTIAPTWQQRKTDPLHMWALKDEDQDIYDRSTTAEDTTRAYVHFAGLQKSEDHMIKFLKIYGSSNKLNQRIPKEAKKNFLIGEIERIIKTDLKGYLNIIDSTNWDARVLLEDAIEIGAITKKVNKYFLASGDAIDSTDHEYQSTVKMLEKWMEDQDERYLVIQSRINGSK